MASKQNRETVLKSINKSEDRLAMAKLLDKAEFAVKTHRLAHSDFLDPHLLRLAENILPLVCECEHSFFGGFSGAQRAVAVFRPEFTDDDELRKYLDAILTIIEVTPLFGDRLTHRDYLGALMSLGIRRDVTGDIIVSEDKCSIIVLSEIAGYIAGNLTKVGNIGISLELSDIMELTIPEPETTEIRATVAALRLDSLCASAFGISRSKAVEYIKSGMVQLNWEAVLSTDKPVREGDTVSIRGKGRAVLEKVSGKTRKDRTTIFIKKFV